MNKFFKWLFILTSVASAGCIYYFYENYGFIETLVSAIALYVSALGLVVCGWIGNKKRINYLIKDSVETHKKLFASEDVVRDLTIQLGKKIERVDVLNKHNEELAEGYNILSKKNEELKVSVNNDTLEISHLNKLKIEREKMYSEQLQINADQEDEIKGLHKKVLEWSNLYDNEVKEHTKSLIRPSCLRTKSKKKSKPSAKRAK